VSSTRPFARSASRVKAHENAVPLMDIFSGRPSKMKNYFSKDKRFAGYLQ
jgi:hypothetical protein